MTATDVVLKRRLLKRGFFRLARNTSKYSDCDIHVGAVLSRKAPIAVGFNVHRTHPVFSNPDTDEVNSIHAEVKAIMNAGIPTDGTEIYVYRETASYAPALARPCERCYNFLRENGVKKMFYSISEPPYWRCERIV